MNNRHRQVDKLCMIKARMFVKQFPSAVEMLAISQVYKARMAKLMDIYKQLPEKFENYLKNTRKES